MGMSQENYLALDIGEKRIGVAVGSVVPFGKGYLDATNKDQVIASLRNLILENHITTLVVGVPRVRSGDITESQKNALTWIESLKQLFGLPVASVDESYSSLEAENQLKNEKVDIKSEKWRIDERAAELILAQYLNETKSNPHEFF
jgi:putative holliday junction resolvase